jgi:5-methylcytosine-specific restriction endonuclease McrA
MNLSAGIPFERYRGSGRTLLGRPPVGDGTCRHGYGPPVFAECGTACVYCDRGMGESYESWLHLSVDHVIPSGTVKQLGWPREWVEDIANLVTCCRACNELLNGYRVADTPPATVNEFFALRDRHFIAKRARAGERHVRERDAYERWADARELA